MAIRDLRVENYDLRSDGVAGGFRRDFEFWILNFECVKFPAPWAQQFEPAGRQSAATAKRYPRPNRCTKPLPRSQLARYYGGSFLFIARCSIPIGMAIGEAGLLMYG